MTRLQTLTANAFKLPSLATSNEAHIGRIIRRSEIAAGHRRKFPTSPDRAGIERDAASRVSESAVIGFLRNCHEHTSTQRVMQDGLAGVVTPAGVQNAIRNLWSAQLVKKHVSSTGNRNWYQLTDKGLSL